MLDYFIPLLACGICFFWGWAFGYGTACKECDEEHGDAE